MKPSIPERICEGRKALGLTQEQLGTILGVSPQAVSKWEKGQTLPDLLLIPQLCRALGISADDLLGVEAPRAARGTAKVTAGEVRIDTPTGVKLHLAGAQAVRAVRETGTQDVQELLALLQDDAALTILRALSFTAVGFEAEIAARCDLPLETARDALLHLLRREICQCTPDGYVLGCNAHLAYAALAAAWIAGPGGRAEIRSITTSYSTQA